MMLIFESTKTNTPIAQQDLAAFLISPLPTYYTTMATTIAEEQVKMTHKHIQTKANTDMCETKQNQLYSTIKKKKQHNLSIRFQAFSQVLCTAGKLLRYLRRSYLLPDYNPSC